MEAANPATARINDKTVLRPLKLNPMDEIVIRPKTETKAMDSAELCKVEEEERMPFFAQSNAVLE